MLGRRLRTLDSRWATRDARGFNSFVTDKVAGNQQTAIGIVHEVGPPGT